MTYRIVLESSAHKALKRHDPPVRRDADRVILALADEPRPPGCRALKGLMKGHFRVKFGPRAGWRLVYRVDDGVLLVSVIGLDTRGDIY